MGHLRHARQSTGTVDPTCAHVDFKRDDVSSANVTSKNIKILDDHLMAPDRWAELKSKPGGTNIIVLAFRDSQRGFNNVAPLGNNGKL